MHLLISKSFVSSNVTVLTTAEYGPLTINVVDAVIDIPMHFSASLGHAGLSTLGDVLSTIPYTYYINGTARKTTYFDAFNAGGGTGVRGYTLFAPNDQALAAAASTLAGLAGNTTILTTIIQNHVSTKYMTSTDNLVIDSRSSRSSTAPRSIPRR